MTSYEKWRFYTASAVDLRRTYIKAILSPAAKNDSKSIGAMRTRKLIVVGDNSAHAQSANRQCDL